MQYSIHVHVHVIHVSFTINVCLSGLWLGGLLYLSFLSDFLKLVFYAHVFPCLPNYMYEINVQMYTCMCEVMLFTYMPTVPVLKAGHPGVPSYCMFVCLGYGWVGCFTFLFFLKASVLCTCISIHVHTIYMYIYMYLS